MNTRQSEVSALAAKDETWARTVFGNARLGDVRRNERLVATAAQAAARPHGQVNVTFGADSGARQGAYKLLEKKHCPHSAALAAAAGAAWKSAKDLPFVVVVADPCTLSLQAASLHKGFGPVANMAHKSYGAESINAVLLDPEGTPLGVASQFWWVRPTRARSKNEIRNLPVTEKETRAWLDVGQQTLDGAREAGFKGKVWFQFDAGADTRDVLEWFAWEPGAEVTVRCRQDRNVVWPEEAKLPLLVAQQPVLGTIKVKVARNGRRGARTATLQLRATGVVLPLRAAQSKAPQPLAVHVVEAVEVGSCPSGEDSIHWILLTTRPGHGFRGARAAVRTYAKRWRVEEVYKTWKSGTCHVEDSHLTYESFVIWALVLFCVAVRIERLKRLARTQPDLTATEEFTPHELQALVTLRRMRRRPTQDWQGLTVEEAVRWVAELGGYTGKSSGGPPGSIVIGRGLEQLAPAVELLGFLRSEK